MSSKNIVSKQHGVLNKSMKTVAPIYKFCQFSQRLEYKCKLLKNNYKYVNGVINIYMKTCIYLLIYQI